MKLKNREAVAGSAFVLPFILGFCIFFIIPFIMSLYYCFTKGIGTIRFVGLENFIDLINSKSYRLAITNTLKFNAVSVPLIMLVSFLFALLLSKKTRSGDFFRVSFIMPLVVPVASVILIWQIFFNEYGVLNRVLHNAGINTVDWMGSEGSFYTLVLLYVWKNCGYNIILFILGLNSIPVEYYESAYIDGAGRFRCMISITLPYLVPTTFYVFIISIINSFKVFREAYLLAGSYPPFEIYMLQHFMNNNFFKLNYQRLSTAAFIMLLFIIALVSILYSVEKKLSKNY